MKFHGIECESYTKNLKSLHLGFLCEQHEPLTDEQWTIGMDLLNEQVNKAIDEGAKQFEFRYINRPEEKGIFGRAYNMKITPLHETEIRKAIEEHASIDGTPPAWTDIDDDLASEPVPKRQCDLNPEQGCTSCE